MKRKSNNSFSAFFCEFLGALLIVCISLAGLCGWGELYKYLTTTAIKTATTCVIRADGLKDVQQLQESQRGDRPYQTYHYNLDCKSSVN